jgi:hypothetical protein
VGGFVSSEGFLRFQGLDEQQQQQHEEEAIVESELLDFLCNTHTHSWLPPTICIFVVVPIVIFFSTKEFLLLIIVVFQLTSEKKLLYGLRILGGGRTL